MLWRLQAVSIERTPKTREIEIRIKWNAGLRNALKKSHGRQEKRNSAGMNHQSTLVIVVLLKAIMLIGRRTGHGVRSKCPPKLTIILEGITTEQARSSQAGLQL